MEVAMEECAGGKYPLAVAPVAASSLSCFWDMTLTPPLPGLPPGFYARSLAFQGLAFQL